MLGDVVGLGKHQDEQEGLLAREGGQQLVELCAGGGVETDERIVHDQDSGLGEEGLGQLVFPELSAGEQDDVFVGELIEAEQLVDMPLQLPPLGSVVSRE